MNVASPVIGCTTSVPAGSPVIGSIISIGPEEGSTPLTCVTVNGLPFGSISFSSKLVLAGVPTGTETRSSFACGSSFCVGSGSATTFSVTVAVSTNPPVSTIE